MKRILLSLVLIMATSAMVAGATQAVFTDSDTWDGNTVSTATVSIDARSEPMGLLPKPLIASGLVPGQYTGWSRGVIFNEASSAHVKLYMYVANLSSWCGQINLQVYTGHAASGAASERSMLLYNGALSGLVGAANKVEITGAGHVFNPTIGPNNSAVIQQRAQLGSAADNSYQNRTCTWDEVFVAETP